VRLKAPLSAVLLTAIAAALAWYIAHRVLGHTQPFFAPIAAAISLGTSRVQRARRVVQLVGGVLLGIAIGEGLTALFGTATVVLGVIVFLTLVAAIVVGVGFVGEGVLFANQAAASAILVVTLHRHGIGGERALDAIVGGGVGLILGVGLFPAQPLSLLRDAERGLLRALAGTLAQASAMVAGGGTASAQWSLARGAEVQEAVGALARARVMAHNNVRIAPRRWRLRAVVDHEISRLTRFDALAVAVLGVARAATAPRDGGTALPASFAHDLDVLAAALGRLASAPQPWPPRTLDAVRAATAEVIATASAQPVDPVPVVSALLRTTAVDLAEVVDLGGAHAAAVE
jgi:uncharacterized membrane protein YgaE (UPF0421/DUF939 family)